jgi:hypothetical protein
MMWFLTRRFDLSCNGSTKRAPSVSFYVSLSVTIVSDLSYRLALEESDTAMLEDAFNMNRLAFVDS